MHLFWWTPQKELHSIFGATRCNRRQLLCEYYWVGTKFGNYCVCSNCLLCQHHCLFMHFVIYSLYPVGCKFPFLSQRLVLQFSFCQYPFKEKKIPTDVLLNQRTLKGVCTSCTDSSCCKFLSPVIMTPTSPAIFFMAVLMQGHLELSFAVGA